MSKPSTIFFVTGARSEYDLMSPVIGAVNAQPGLRAEVVACAGHMSPFHGLGVREIRADGFTIAAEIESLLSSESKLGRALSFGHLFQGLVRTLAEKKPDLVFVAGDREEALAAALAADFIQIPVAHLHGGDRCIASELDEVLRPAISKLSHLHFTATEGHRERLIRMGEDPAHVWCTGAPGLDRLASEPDLGDEALSREFGVDVTQPFFLLIHHPSPLFDAGTEEMQELLAGVLALGRPVFCSYPNYDPGNIGMRQAIDALRTKHPQLMVYHNLPRRAFVSLYRRCAAIVGNSSSIVIESAFLKKPGVLVGHRQDLREIGPNVVRIEAERAAVTAACQACLGPERHSAAASAPSLYGDGHSAERIAAILAATALPKSLLLKTMMY